MTLLLRRLIVSLLIPYLWRRWRGRSNSRRDLPRATALQGQPQPRAGVVNVTTGLVSGAEY